MATTRKIPVWAQQIQNAQATEIRNLKEQVVTLESNWEASPISRHVGLHQVFIPNGTIRFQLSEHVHIDVRIGNSFVGGVGNYLNINGSDYLTMHCAGSNLIEVTARDRFTKE